MKNVLHQNSLRVKKSRIHGYGVFTETDINPEGIIEECHILKTSNYDDNFANYYFDVKNLSGIPLGFGCIYNHAEEPNADYYYDEELDLMVYFAKKFIPKGEEIFVNYGPEWFNEREMRIKHKPFISALLAFMMKIPFRAAIVCAGVYGCIWLLSHTA